MTKPELLQIIKREYVRTHSIYWMSAHTKLTKLDCDTVLSGLTRYVESAQNHGIELEPGCFNEILDDAKANQFIWLVADNDLAQLKGMKYTKGMSAKII